MIGKYGEALYNVNYVSSLLRGFLTRKNLEEIKEQNMVKTENISRLNH